MGGNFKFRQTSPTPLEREKQKLLNHLDQSERLRSTKGVSCHYVEQGHLIIFFLDSTRIITVPTCDPIVFGLLPMSQLLPLLCGGGESIGQNIFHYREIPEREIPVDG